ncbi:MAG: alpha-amylase family glycosyl hydrolase [bacterium]|nr:alpha-amylase family glycosyl hydrolase [bacterium]
MAWYDEAVFYHIYPLGLAGAPTENPYGEPVHRLNTLIPWIAHCKKIGCNALYIGPLFESVGHGYETTDYRKLDSRLGDNADLTAFVKACHEQGIRVIFDGVFNHVGRDFFAFQDLKQNRENSAYKDWFCNVNFLGNNEYNDGFSYDNWGGYNLLVKLNQRNPAVRDYICDVIRFWVSEFDVDGIRLDAADVLDFEFMRALRGVANEVKPEFWLMGEVIHGDYTRWVNEGTLHSVTNYHLHKALYSGHNDHNYFEIAHTVTRLYGMGGNRPDGLKLYNFVDNHDVERIYTKLNNKAHYAPVHVLLYTLPGVPSVYYGSEFGIEGKKEKFSDASLRPALSLDDYKDALTNNACTKLTAALGKIRQASKALSYGDYQQLLLTNRQYAFSRNTQGETAIVTVNNDDSDYVMTVACGSGAEFVGALSGQRVSAVNGTICVNVKANSGEIWLMNADQFETDAAGESGAKDAADETPGGAQSGTEAAGAGTDADGAQTESTAGETRDSVQAESTAGETQNNVQAESTAGETQNSVQAESTAGETQNNAQAGDIAAVQTGAHVQKEENGGAEGEGAGTCKSMPETNAAETAKDEAHEAMNRACDEAFERGRIAGLQEAILAIMEKNGNVTDRMRQDVYDNVYHDSLVNWVKSFR